MTARGHPWRENVEAMTMAVVVALLLKCFLLDAYKVPSGSMQPTLIGIDEGGVVLEDRILVDKVSLRLRDPRRFEVIVFRYPLDHSKSFVKRVVGMPGEDFRVEGGDLWTRRDRTEDWTVLRRPRSVQRSTWKRLDRREPDESSWRASAPGWEVAGRTIAAVGSGRAEFRPGRGSIMDGYSDGYPDAILDLDVVPRVHQDSGTNPVGDLRLEARVAAEAGCSALELELREGRRRYTFRVPGPAASDSARPGIEVDDAGARSAAETEDSWRLPAGRTVSVAAQNLDDLLELEIDGEVVLALEVAPARDAASSIALEVHGAGARLDDLMAYRDIYYTNDRAKVYERTIPEGSYFVLGDNTQNSSDSREWTLLQYSVTDPETDEARLVRGPFERQNSNPYVDAGNPSGPVLWFRDEWGELHRIPQEHARLAGSEAAPLVARELILGRAVATFWPISPLRGIYRVGWVR